MWRWRCWCSRAWLRLATRTPAMVVVGLAAVAGAVIAFDHATDYSKGEQFRGVQIEGVSLDPIASDARRLKWINVAVGAALTAVGADFILKGMDVRVGVLGSRASVSFGW